MAARSDPVLGSETHAFLTAIAGRLAERLRESGQKLQVYARLVQTLQQQIDTLMPTPDRRK